MTVYQLSLFEHDVLPAPLDRILTAVDTASTMVEDTKAYFHRKVASYTSFFTDALVPKMAPPPSKDMTTATTIRVSARKAELDREMPFLAEPRVASASVLAALRRIRHPPVSAVMASRLPYLVGPHAPPVGRSTADVYAQWQRERENAPPPPPPVPAPVREPELVVFGPPTTFQSMSEYELDILVYSTGRRGPRVRFARPPTTPFEILSEEVRRRILETTESIVVRPNGLLEDIFHRMNRNEQLGPRELTADESAHFCGCGLCPNGVATTRECAFLTIYRSLQRFRRRATASPAIIALNRWRNPCFTTPALQHKRS